MVIEGCVEVLVRRLPFYVDFAIPRFWPEEGRVSISKFMVDQLKCFLKKIKMDCQTYRISNISNTPPTNVEQLAKSIKSLPPDLRRKIFSLLPYAAVKSFKTPYLVYWLNGRPDIGLDEMGLTTAEMDTLLQRCGNGLRHAFITVNGAEFTQCVVNLTGLTSLSIAPNVPNACQVLRIAEKTNLSSLALMNHSANATELHGLSLLPHLKSLNLAWHQFQIEEFEAVVALTGLTCLNLESQRSNDFILQIGKLIALPHLIELDLSNNSGEAVLEVTRLTRLLKLNVSECSLKTAQATSIAALPQLTCLNLKLNYLEFPGPMFNVNTSLRVLNLSHCGLGTLPRLSHLGHLTELNYSQNLHSANVLTQLAQLTQLKVLTYTQFEGHIGHLINTINKLPHLAYLNIGDNVVKHRLATIYPDLVVTIKS